MKGVLTLAVWTALWSTIAFGTELPSKGEIEGINVEGGEIVIDGETYKVRQDRTEVKFGRNTADLSELEAGIEVSYKSAGRLITRINVLDSSEQSRLRNH